MDILHDRFGIGFLPAMEIDPASPGLRSENNHRKRQSQRSGLDGLQAGSHKKGESRKYHYRVTGPNEDAWFGIAQDPRRQQSYGKPDQRGSRPAPQSHHKSDGHHEA